MVKLASSSFQESDEKEIIRKLIRQAAETLGRENLTYLGLPERRAEDIRMLVPFVRNVICVDFESEKLKATARVLARLKLDKKVFWAGNMWEYLRDYYPVETLVADIAFLDFLGGGIRSKVLFAEEIAGVRNYFTKQSRYQNRAFVFAWTFMPRDSGPSVYTDGLSKLLPEQEIRLIAGQKGWALRALAIRFLLKQILREHNMNVKLFHHAVYKRVMNCVILIYSNGADTNLSLELHGPESILNEAIYVYRSNRLPEPKALF
jgi:hypothetical protein